MLTYVADVFGHALVEPPFFWRKIKVQRGLFFCKAELIIKHQKLLKYRLSLSEHDCLNLSERYSLYYLHIIWYPISSNAEKPAAQFNDVLSIIPLII